MDKPAQPKTFKDLHLWKAAKALMADVYRLCASGSTKLDPDLISQVRRASSSVVFNIAEGHGRSSNKDCCRFLFIAKGSLLELDAQFEVCTEIGLIRPGDTALINKRISETGKLLGGLIRYRQRLPDQQAVTKTAKTPPRPTDT